MGEVDIDRADKKIDEDLYSLHGGCINVHVWIIYIYMATLSNDKLWSLRTGCDKL